MYRINRLFLRNSLKVRALLVRLNKKKLQKYPLDCNLFFKKQHLKLGTMNL
jgi:hypothetical protein